VSRRDDKALAAQLARALDGQERPQGDVAALVTVLERATEPARFEVARELVERELARARLRLGDAQRRYRRPAPRLALAFGAAAAAAVAIVVFTFLRVPGLDVEGKALAALGGGGILQIEERIEPAVPGAFPVSTRTVWFDPATHRQHSVQVSHGRTVEETLVEPGRVSRYLPGANLVIVAPSCRAFASGCADIVDPVAFYRRALKTEGVAKTKREGGAYVLTLPVQTLPDAVRIEQRVTIDADTFLPKVIEWREQRPGGPLHPVSRIVIEQIRRLSPDELADPFHLSLLDSTRIEQRTVSKVPVRKLGTRSLSPAEARQVSPPLQALGRPQAVEEIRWNAGTAYRLDYGGITVWNYRNVVPPRLVSNFLSGPAKVVPVGKLVARFYETRAGRWLVEVDTRSWSVAIEAPGEGKINIFRLAGMLKPLR
jgi:hypothetical protein